MMKISTDSPAFRVRPAQPGEAGAFFAQTPEQYAQMGAIGCVRMDFGRSGTAFWHTWHPRGREELNSPEFKAELQQVVDTLRETVLKDLPSMRHFCYENGGIRLNDAGISGEKSVALMVGSEGGFDRDEAELAEQSGAKLIWLGKRILRCETCPIAVSAVVMNLSGNL